MTKEITLKVGEMIAVQGNYHIKSLGIGSCAVIVFYDKKNKIAAMAHSMLPTAHGLGEESKGVDRVVEGTRVYDAKYIDSTIPKMLDLILKLGADKDKLKIKLVGGAAMFRSFVNNNQSVGSNNIEVAKKAIKELGLKINAENTGGNHGRSVDLNTSNGVLNVNSRI